MAAEIFGITKKGEMIHQYEICHGKMKAVVMEYGAAIRSLLIPTDNGMIDVALGYDTLEEYEEKDIAMGAIVGRVTNRISDAKFCLDGNEYILDKNDGENYKDGGFDGFHKRVWKNIKKSDAEVTFLLESPDKDQGFPGNLHIEVTYSVRDDMALVIQYHVISDQDTPLSISNHSYFNLHGQGCGDIMDHILQIYSAMYMPVRGKDRIPDGRTQNVFSTAFDFGYPKRIGKDLYNEDIQLKYGNGYDHNYLIALNKGMMKTIANVKSEKTGIGLEVRSDMPGVQFYSGNDLRVQKGKDGALYYPHSGFVLETQYWPNSINIQGFLPGILRKGIPWNSKTVYRFYNI